MKKFFSLAVMLLLSSSLMLKSQLVDVIVETYYISDENDSIDAFGSRLAEGSTTYRIFLDLEKGTRLRRIYGNTFHPLLISSSSAVYNHSTFDQEFGHNLNSSYLQFGTSALDSWLTMSFSNSTYQAIPKELDPDTSIIGGAYNQGGHLSNDHPDAGIPVTEADGMVKAERIAADFEASGLPLPGEGFIFRKGSGDSVFYSESFSFLHYIGIQGTTDENLILVAQITTRGALAFRLNVELLDDDFITATNSRGIVRYVSDNDTLIFDPAEDIQEIFSNLLTYPPSCGCTDPYFAQFDPEATCDDGSCKDSVIFGCLDPVACNYDPSANFHLKELCCYGPDNCDGREIVLVCPDRSGLTSASLYPNPVQNSVFLQVIASSPETAQIEVFDAFGQLRMESPLDLTEQESTHEINLEGLEDGIYLVRIITRSDIIPIRLVKHQ